MRLALFVVVAAAACSAERARPVPPAPPPLRPAPVVAAPAAPVVAVADPAPPVLRLPGDVVPVQYGLDLTVVPDQPAATGSVHIAATVVKPARVVWLNASGLTIHRAELAGQPARVIAGGNDFVGLTVDRELPAGGLAIDLAFTATVDRERARGLYSEREGNDVYAYTFFEPIDARRAFPCFDEPIYKVPWQLTFHVRQDHVALANAAIERETVEPGGMKRVETALTKPLPSYLVAFVVGPFELIDGGTAGRAATPIRFVIPKGRAAELGYARRITPKVVAALEDYFAMPYPYGKLDIAVVPRYWGTMEHPGILAMGQPLTLIRPDQETRARKLAYTNIVAHELSHYWFGDLVTTAWWDDTWLNEALGEWSDMNITEAAEPTWRVRDERVGMAARAMHSDETLATQSIRQPVTTREGIAASFDASITYLKGAAMFRMFEAFVGRDAWREFVLGYLAAHAWRNASADQFLAELGGKLGAPVATAMRSFLEQPGVPLIAGAVRCEAHQPPRLELTQARSLPAGVTDPAPKRWEVPVCVRYGDARTSARQCHLMTGATATVELGDPHAERRRLGDRMTRASCPTWLIVNADATGYYRSVVDPALARALLTPGSAIARAARPTPSERMMLVEDLRAAVARAALAPDALLALVPVIAGDPDPKVARSAVAAAELPLKGLDDPTYLAARRWYVRAFGPRARQLGWLRGDHDVEEVHELRRALVPLVADDDPALARQAAALAEQWLAHRTGITDDLAPDVLAAAARHGDAARFERYLAAARAARDRTEQVRLLAALGAFTDPALVRRALELVRGHDLDLRDTVGIVAQVFGRRENRDLGIAFVTEHLDELLARMRDDEGSWFVASLAGAFCDTGRQQQMTALVVPRAAKIDGAQASVTRALEQSAQCIARVARELPALRRALDARR